ncbi:MAG: Gfo/Idh/MocA family oxidoreductase [Verrucomicrobiales bacterium]|nr:Gfo/Idh/MocA family oxidoreductase [Verrucomicrobiales bacterium]
MTHKIGVLGLHHDHVWGNLEELQRTGKAEIIGAADPWPELREKFQNQFGGTVFGNYDELLQNSDLTAVYIFANNKDSEELAVKACEKGLHCLVEKPMAATLDGARKMLEAAEQNKVRLMINWPFMWWPQLRHAIELADSGRIGKLWEVRYRAAHQGPVELGCSPYFCEWLYDRERNGAGAMMDYCCYGAVLCQVLLGSPESVHGVGLNTGTKPDLKLEDNAVLILQYPNALGVTEASWTQIGKLTAYNTTIYGTEGTLYIEPDYQGRVLLATIEDYEGSALEIPPSPAHLDTASTHFLAAIEDPNLELHPLCDAKNCCDAQAILEVGKDLM